MGATSISLQESAEELGYSTIEEAIDAGYEVVGDDLRNAHFIKPTNN